MDIESRTNKSWLTETLSGESLTAAMKETEFDYGNEVSECSVFG